LSFGKLTATRVFYFWAGDPLDYTTAIPNSVLSLAGLIGCVLLVRRHPYAGWLIACAFVFYPLIYYLTQSTPRYTLPIHPLVALCAAYALWTAFHFWRPPTSQGPSGPRTSRTPFERSAAI
jgi:hypothetical protein